VRMSQEASEWVATKAWGIAVTRSVRLVWQETDRIERNGFMANRIYQVIYDDLSAQIAEGVPQPDARLPSESDLNSRTATTSAV